MLGKTHSEETKKKISEALKGKNHPMFGKKHTEQAISKISAAIRGKKSLMFGKKHTEETLAKMSAARLNKSRPEGSGSPLKRIVVLNVLTNERTEYESISAAAKALNIRKSTISLFLANNQQKPYKNLFIFKEIE